MFCIKWVSLNSTNNWSSTHKQRFFSITQSWYRVQTFFTFLLTWTWFLLIIFQYCIKLIVDDKNCLCTMCKLKYTFHFQIWATCFNRKTKKNSNNMSNNCRNIVGSDIIVFILWQIRNSYHSFELEIYIQFWNGPSFILQRRE